MKKIDLYLIKPAQYDDDGYLVRHWRGILPSNTLACLAGLTEDLLANKRLGQSFQIHTHLIDESVQRLPLKRICRGQQKRGKKTIVCLVGVQTSQFPRAADLAYTFRQAGLTVLIGGFHVSGLLAMLPEIPLEMQKLMKAGVTLVKGEVEDRWLDLLRDAVEDKLKPLYDFLDQKPNLYQKPLPLIDKKYMRKFIYNYGTLDCGRGCPFECSFCAIINVQGHKMRYRNAQQVATAVRRNYQERGISFYFFTDDNFSRNKNWEQIFDAFIRLREEEKIPVKFMMQVDVLSFRLKGFVKKAQRAGCNSVFIGMESINSENLQAAGKKQNSVTEYRQLIETYRHAEIASLVGYIIGFPGDSVESVHSDLQRLMREVKPDTASFFMLMPLPGSRDHLEMWQRGVWMDPDFNNYDSTHETTKHPLLKNGSWSELYHQAWRSFYSFDNMKAVLLRSPRSIYWNNFLRFVWYKNSVEVDGRHPMLSGFFRLKGRKNRRAGYAILSPWQYLLSRSKEIYQQARKTLRLFWEMEELWLQTRHPSQIEQRIADELKKILTATRGHLKLKDFQLAHLRAKVQFPTLCVPSKMKLLWAKYSPLLVPSKVYTRADIDLFWHRAKENIQARRWFSLPLARMPFYLLREIQILLLFLIYLIRLN